MRVVLLSDVKKLGKTGQVVEVSDGFARNFLLPKGLALLGDEKALSILAQKAKLMKQREELGREKDSKLGQKLSGLSLEIEELSDDKGNLYAGLKESEIFAKIRESGQDLPEKVALVDYSPVKKVGKHKVVIKVGENSAEIRLKIKGRNDHGKKSG